MNILLENKERISTSLTGFFQFEKGGLFDYALLAVAANEVYIFSDNMPDAKQPNGYVYLIKKRIRIDEIVRVSNEKMIKDKKLKNMNRLYIECKDPADTIHFYYQETQSAKAANVLGVLKQRGVKKFKKRKVNPKAIKKI